MRVSARSEYGLRVLIELAASDEGVPIPARQIAERQQIPIRFLEQQMTTLRKAGLITSRRGAGGGCSLARPATQISVAEAVEALDGRLIDVSQRKDRSSAARVVRELWGNVGDGLRDSLSRTTIADLAARKRQLDEAASPMFYI